MPQRRDGFSRILRSRLSRILKRGGPSSYSRIARNGFSRILRSSPIEESPEYFYEMEDPEESDYYMPAEDKRIIKFPPDSKESRILQDLKILLQDFIICYPLKSQTGP